MVANLSWCQLVFNEISVCWKLPNHVVSFAHDHAGLLFSFSPDGESICFCFTFWYCEIDFLHYTILCR